MSGSGTQKRQHALAIRCAKLDAQGYTHRQIAQTVGIKDSLVKARIQLGQRLLSL